MRHYEIVFMIHPDQSEQVPAMIERYTTPVARPARAAGTKGNRAAVRGRTKEKRQWQSASPS